MCYCVIVVCCSVCFVYCVVQTMSTVETQSITYSRGGEDGENTVTISVASTTHAAVLSDDGLQGKALKNSMPLCVHFYDVIS